MNWPIEIIPDSDFLYRRIHINSLITSQNLDNIPPFAFKDNKLNNKKSIFNLNIT